MLCLYFIGFGTPVLLVIDRDQEKPVSTIFIHGNQKWNHPEDRCVCVRFHLEIYIFAVTREVGVDVKHGEWTDALLEE